MNILKAIIVFFILTAAVLHSPTLIAQLNLAESGFKYQAVLRDSNGDLLTNQAISIQTDLHTDSANGTVVYSEVHDLTTNDLGLVMTHIGTGSPISGDFSSVDWGLSDHYISIAIDADSSGVYSPIGTAQLVSVPYAMYAGSSGNIEDDDSDTTNELITNFSRNGTGIQITEAGVVRYVELSSLIDDADSDPTNELQDLQLTGSQLEITGSPSTIDLTNYLDNTDEQSLSFTDPNLSISNGNSVDLSVLSDGTGTDNQTLNLNANQLSIEDGNSVSLSAYLDNTDAQTLSFTEPNLAVSGGNSVNLSALIDDEDWVVTSGTNITNGNTGNVGIGNIASSQNRWQLTVKDTANSMIGSDTIDVSELFAVFTRNLNENNTGIGIGFQSTSTVTGMGAAIVHERTNSNSRGKLHFATKSSGSAAAEDLPIRMTLDETGDLGIGITAPTAKLHISGGDILADRKTSTSSLTRSLTLGGARNGDAIFGRIDFQNYDDNGGLADYVGSSIRAGNGGDAADKGDLRFFTYDGSLSEAMRVSESGELGIGETDPQASLDVVDNAVIGNISIGSESTAQAGSNNAGDGFAVSPWLYSNAIEAAGERGASSTLITVGDDGTFGGADQIHFVTNGNSQMQISSDGKFGIDKSPNTDIHIRQSQQSITNGTGGIKFEDSSDDTDYWRTYHSGVYFSFNLQGSRVAYVNTNGSWTVDSDRRLKRDILTLNPILSKVMQLRPVSYLYTNQDDEAQRTIGFVAQEAKPLFPELVVEGEDGHYGMTYGHTGVIAIKAIQEQQQEIEKLKQQNEQLKSTIEAIMEHLELDIKE